MWAKRAHRPSRRLDRGAVLPLVSEEPTSSIWVKSSFLVYSCTERGRLRRSAPAAKAKRCSVGIASSTIFRPAARLRRAAFLSAMVSPSSSSRSASDLSGRSGVDGGGSVSCFVRHSSIVIILAAYSLVGVSELVIATSSFGINRILHILKQRITVLALLTQSAGSPHQRQRSGPMAAGPTYVFHN